MPTHDVAASTELRFLLDRCFAAHQANRPELADAFARAAEAILRAAFPNIAEDIARAASRKGQGDTIGSRLAEHVDASSAACVAIVLTLRSARRRVVDVLAEAFVGHPDFQATTKMLCERVFGTPSASPSVVVHPAVIEVAAPRGR